MHGRHSMSDEHTCVFDIAMPSVEGYVYSGCECGRSVCTGRRYVRLNVTVTRKIEQEIMVTVEVPDDRTFHDVDELARAKALEYSDTDWKTTQPISYRYEYFRRRLITRPE